jgi:alpha-N-arabinofuranosidase
MSAQPGEELLRHGRVVSVDLRRAAAATAAAWAAFDFFSYAAREELPRPPLPDEFTNPVLPGFHPDPSICRVGDDFYLATSSFALFPGIPLFHSRDLVSWTPIGHVLDRPSQISALADVRVSGGAYAPTLRHWNGKFYLTSTLVGGGGNFITTSDAPEGPWADPIWMPGISGIDPSPYFEDGRCYIVHNGDCPGAPRYEGHKAIWLREVSPTTGESLGPSHLLVDGGTDLRNQPIWIEGPHLYRRDGFYYLVASEGGTGEDHSVVAFRSANLTGPYLPWSGNPILTQRDLPEHRTDKVTCTGHADFVELQDGSWWAVFLGCSPYDGRHYNTGRQTYLLPVDWPEGRWPTVLPPGQPVPRFVRRPLPQPKQHDGTVALAPRPSPSHWRDEFLSAELSPEWVTVRPPFDRWMDVGSGALRLAPKGVTLRDMAHASFAARRQQHAHFRVETALRIGDLTADCDAGIAAFQDDRNHFFLGVRIQEGKPAEVFVETVVQGTVIVVGQRLLPPHVGTIGLRVTGRGGPHDFHVRTSDDPHAWEPVATDIDGRALSTWAAGGFQGVCLGLHARAIG